MTQLIPADQVHFTCGEPLCTFDECYRCFEERDVLYRLVNREKQHWWFYNDTTDTIVHVRVLFSPESVVKPLQRTQLRRVPRADGSVDNSCQLEAKIDVEPGFTESFIEGSPEGFEMKLHSETAPAKDVEFENGIPKVSYNKIYRCFKNNGNGLLFRLVDAEHKRWYFYNDTRDFIMTVKVSFANKKEVVPIGNTTVDAAATEAVLPDGVAYTLTIPPRRTEAFIEGSPDTFTLGFAAESIAAPAADAGEESSIEYLNGSPDVTVIPHQSHVFRCFKEHSNGLLFRVVDDPNNIWAFYNDTREYSMAVSMRYPLHENSIQFAPGVQAIADAESPGFAIAGIEVPPLTTVPFLVGTPQQYKLAFAANPVNASPAAPADSDASSVTTGSAAAPGGMSPTPELKPQYECGRPDPQVMPTIDEVFRCFKEHGNGLLFRLVDRANHRWAFYNDTVDVIMSVAVVFPPSANIRALGKTQVSIDDAGSAVYVLSVSPMETALFVEGDVATFTTKFTAHRLA